MLQARSRLRDIFIFLTVIRSLIRLRGPMSEFLHLFSRPKLNKSQLRNPAGDFSRLGIAKYFGDIAQISRSAYPYRRRRLFGRLRQECVQSW